MEFRKCEKVIESLGSRDSGTFVRFYEIAGCVKCHGFSIRSCADLCESAKATKVVALLMACQGTYVQVEFYKSEKSFSILKISEFWYFFQIFDIPLLSTFTDHAKCFGFFRPLLYTSTYVRAPWWEK